jgi:acyl-CoA thioesterase FadM
VHEQSIVLPRNAFSPREAARAADLWRACQDVAVGASIAGGWPPIRYREAGTSFVVRSELVVHHRETAYGDALRGTTWVSRFRRQMLSTREVRIRDAAGPIVTARQEWVHVSAQLEPARAGDSLTSAFPVEPGPDGDVGPEMPRVARPIEPHAAHVFGFEAWNVWMDPLAHANHPAYVDYCEEAIARALLAAGLDPVAVVPVAEEVLFKSGVVAGEKVRVESTAEGWTESGAAVIGHRILVGERVCAIATTVRRLLGDDGPSRITPAVRA